MNRKHRNTSKGMAFLENSNNLFLQIQYFKARLAKQIIFLLVFNYYFYQNMSTLGQIIFISNISGWPATQNSINSWHLKVEKQALMTDSVAIYKSLRTICKQHAQQFQNEHFITTHWFNFTINICINFLPHWIMKFY